MKERVIAYATDVVGLATRRLTILWYSLTASFPRRLPRSEDDLQRLKQVIVDNYGLEDHPHTWAVIMNGLQNRPKTSLYFSYRALVNPAIRLKIDGLAESHKRLAYREIEANLKSAAEKVVNESESEMPGRTLDLSANM